MCHSSQPGPQCRSRLCLSSYNPLSYDLFLAQEVDEVYYLVFPAQFVILAVGQSLSGYEIKVSGEGGIMLLCTPFHTYMTCRVCVAVHLVVPVLIDHVIPSHDPPFNMTLYTLITVVLAEHVSTEHHVHQARAALGAVAMAGGGPPQTGDNSRLSLI